MKYMLLYTGSICWLGSLQGMCSHVGNGLIAHKDAVSCHKSLGQLYEQSEYPVQVLRSMVDSTLLCLWSKYSTECITIVKFRATAKVFGSLDSIWPLIKLHLIGQDAAPWFSEQSWTMLCALICTCI